MPWTWFIKLGLRRSPDVIRFFAPVWALLGSAWAAVTVLNVQLLPEPSSGPGIISFSQNTGHRTNAAASTHPPTQLSRVRPTWNFSLGAHGCSGSKKTVLLVRGVVQVPCAGYYLPSALWSPHLFQVRCLELVAHCTYPRCRLFVWCLMLKRNFVLNLTQQVKPPGHSGNFWPLEVSSRSLYTLCMPLYSPGSILDTLSGPKVPFGPHGLTRYTGQYPHRLMPLVGGEGFTFVYSSTEPKLCP